VKAEGAVLTVLHTATALFHAEMEANASLSASCRLAVLADVSLALPRSPDINTIRTAAYAAVAAKILSLLAEVVIATTNAKAMMKTNRIPNLAASSVTKYKAKIEPTRRAAGRVAARPTPSIRLMMMILLSLRSPV
jgi:hypothetical protein